MKFIVLVADGSEYRLLVSVLQDRAVRNRLQ